MSVSARYTEGLAKLDEIDGEAGRKVIDSLQAIAPDLARYVIEFPFGDIYQRPGLDLAQRELATVAALTALGHCQPQLAVHVHGALNVGCTPEQIVEVVIQMAVLRRLPGRAQRHAHGQGGVCRTVPFAGCVIGKPAHHVAKPADNRFCALAQWRLVG